MLDYKDIIIKSYALHMSGREIAKKLGVSKSGVNGFLKAFKECKKIGYPLPEGITNYGIAECVFGISPDAPRRDQGIELPDFERIAAQMRERQNMTIVFQWNRYVRECTSNESRFYQYRQFCDLYAQWCKGHYETFHFKAVIGETMEVDFAGKTFEIIDKASGEKSIAVVFVAVLPYSQYLYAEGMLSTKEPQWIEVNNHALSFFGGVPALTVCDNCKQAVIVNRDWIEPELNKDYAAWADHNHTAIQPAKVRHPKFKSSVECSVGILEKGFFHDLEERRYFSLDQFNMDLWDEIEKLNGQKLTNREHSRAYYWEEEKTELMPLPSMQYHYMERSIATVSSDFHVRFDKAYYSLDQKYKHQRVSISASATSVMFHTLSGEFICEWPRATHIGQWSTNPGHLPENYRNACDWSASFFIKKAMTIGPSTVEVIKQVLKSRAIECQTYRLCIGILGFSRRYSKQTLEECCRQAIELNRVTYSFIKNTIVSFDNEPDKENRISKINEERNKGAFVMSPDAMDISNLLERSRKLAASSNKEVR